MFDSENVLLGWIELVYSNHGEFEKSDGSKRNIKWSALSMRKIQIMDSHGKEKVGRHDCGALYDAVVPSANASKPAGEWNHMKITVNGASVKVMLNDKQIIAADLDQWITARRNPDGSRNKFRTALKNLPRTGSVGLQYHGHPVWFKNIVLKPL